MAWAAVIAAGGAVAGGLIAKSGSKGSGSSTQKQEIDPRMAQYLYGDGSAGQGLLGQAAGLANQPRSQQLYNFGTTNNDFLGRYGSDSLVQSQNAASQLTNGNMHAPSAQVSSYAEAVGSPSARINAPSQNGLNLSGAYDQMINGDAGANPYLTKALQSGVDQTNASFAKNQTDATNNLMRNVLPGIRSGAQAVGGYGGTRQGIAEGNAIGDFSNQMNTANTQLGLANSANTTGAQAQAFNQGQDRSLNALNTLGGQQYQTSLTQGQFDQQAGSQNSAQAQQANMQNASMQQQVNLANLQSQIGTNALNSANTATGIGLQGGLLGQAYNYATANDAYDRTKLGQITGILSPFSGMGGSTSATSPYYSNTAGNLLGGAAAGLGLYNQYNNASNSGSYNATPNAQNITPWSG